MMLLQTLEQFVLTGAVVLALVPPNVYSAPDTPMVMGSENVQEELAARPWPPIHLPHEPMPAEESPAPVRFWFGGLPRRRRTTTTTAAAPAQEQPAPGDLQSELLRHVPAVELEWSFHPRKLIPSPGDVLTAAVIDAPQNENASPLNQRWSIRNPNGFGYASSYSRPIIRAWRQGPPPPPPPPPPPEYVIETED